MTNLDHSVYYDYQMFCETLGYKAHTPEAARAFYDSVAREVRDFLGSPTMLLATYTAYQHTAAGRHAAEEGRA